MGKRPGRKFQYRKLRVIFSKRTKDRPVDEKKLIEDQISIFKEEVSANTYLKHQEISTYQRCFHPVEL